MTNSVQSRHYPYSRTCSFGFDFDDITICSSVTQQITLLLITRKHISILVLPSTHLPLPLPSISNFDDITICSSITQQTTLLLIITRLRSLPLLFSVTLCPFGQFLSQNRIMILSISLRLIISRAWSFSLVPNTSVLSWIYLHISFPVLFNSVLVTFNQHHVSFPTRDSVLTISSV